MPVISFQQCLQAPVFTKMGQPIGRLIDVECDTENLQVINLLVQPKGITGFFKKPLVIHRSQVIECTQKRIVVDDATVTDPSRVTQEST